MSKEKILVVDDNRMTRDFIQTLLESEGYSVDCSENGISALNLVKEKRFGVFIVDYRMPGMKGDEVVATLRKLCPHEFIIGYSFEPKDQAFLTAGADAFILKEQLDRQLVQLIESNARGRA